MSKKSQPERPFILIYYNFKGLAQIVRQLLCYLDVQYYDIHLDQIEKQKASLPPIVFSQLKGLKIDKNLLPSAVHNGYLVEELYPVMAYICYAFNRQDLLGIDIFQKAKVQEIINIYINKLPHTKELLFSFAERSIVMKDNQILVHLESHYQNVSKSSGYMIQLALLFLRNGRRFILGEHPTIIDFYYLQSSNYMLGIFRGLIDYQLNENDINYIKVKELYAMEQFHNIMKNLPYYGKHKAYLESYSIFGLMSQQRQLGMKRLWALDFKHIH